VADVFQVLKSSLIQSVFTEEWQYIVDHRWFFAEKKPDFLILLDADKLSLWHLDQIQRMIQSDRAEKAKQEADAQKKVRDVSQFTGGVGAHRQ
jgi:hypothetical protein